MKPAPGLNSQNRLHQQGPRPLRRIAAIQKDNQPITVIKGFNEKIA